jgi:hypothetical protein
MIRLMRTVTILALLAAFAFNRGSAVIQPDWTLEIEHLPTPVGAESAQPQLSVSKRGVLLSWIERSSTGATLKFTEKAGGAWGDVRTVASGTNWFVNWADVPSVIRLPDGTLAAHWLQKSRAGTYAYDLRLSYSNDDGRSWSPSFTPHHDGTQTEHGFATLFAMPEGLGLVWLDGRNMKAGQHSGGGHGSDDMTLRFASYGKDWKQTAETALDLRVCECCPTAVAVTPEGPVVAYRDRSPDETRDIHVTRLEKGVWSKAQPLHADGWRVPACPVNGAALSARGRDVAAAWFNARDDQPKSFAAFSSDGGRAFGLPIRLDDESSLGRVDIELLPDGSAAAAYVEFADRKAQFRVRRILPDGSKSGAVTISGMAGNRTSGYPRMALHGGELVFAWTARDPGSQVQTAFARIR